jgi:hypothetical protein
MSAIENFPMLGPSRFAEFAADVEAHRPGGRVLYVSAADLASVLARGKTQVPRRDKGGRRLSARWDEIKTTRAREAFAERHGWPFTVHVANLAEAKEAA